MCVQIEDLWNKCQCVPFEIKTRVYLIQILYIWVSTHIIILLAADYGPMKVVLPGYSIACNIFDF